MGSARKRYAIACRPSFRLGPHKNETGRKSIILSPAKTLRKSYVNVFDLKMMSYPVFMGG